MRASIGLFLLLGFLFFVFDGCTMAKAYSLIKKGTVEQKQFKTEFPFEFKDGLIIIKAKIEGNEYDFLLDTGAPNLISKEIADKLHLKPKFTAEMDDSQNQSAEVDFVQVRKISIGGIDFLDTGAIVADLEEGIAKVSCFKADGIIGANLMRNAVWDIDYEGRKITIANSSSFFQIPDGSINIPFTTGLSGSPSVPVTVNGESIKKVLVDLGMRSDFKFSNSTFKNLLKNKSIVTTVSGNGTLSGSVYGYAEPERDDFALINSISIGDIHLNKQIVTFIDDEKTAKIGTQFLQNYRVIINWFSKELTLVKVKDFEHSEFKTFGFHINYKQSGNVQVSYIYEKSVADEIGLKYGDTIVNINGQNCQNIPLEKWCSIEKGFKSNNKEEVTISVFRGNKEVSYILKKKNLF